MRTRELGVQGHKTVGGLIGFASDSVIIRRSLFDGMVEGKENTGGLVGWVESGTLTDNTVSGSVLGWERTGGVAFIVPFDTPTPLALIRAILPDVLVKGADWPEEQIAGAAEVQAAGGRVLRIPLSPGRSTTAIIRRIAKHVAG